MNNDPTKNPRLKALLNTFEDTMLSIGMLLKNSHIAPALILCYSFIDTLGWLSSRSVNEGVGARFKRFSEEWILKERAWDCTPIDLYAARCALIHTMTGDSDLSKNNQARRIMYTFGSTSVDKLDSFICTEDKEKFARINVTELAQAIKLGAIRYLHVAYNNPDMAQELLVRAKRFYAGFPDTRDIKNPTGGDVT